MDIDCDHLYLAKDPEDLKWVNGESYCRVAHDFIVGYTDPKNTWIDEALVFLMPIWAFFLLNSAHDCFKCLGKDPDRIFSISQFTKDERFARQMKQKYGRNYRIMLSSTEIDAHDLNVEVKLGAAEKSALRRTSHSQKNYGCTDRNES